MALALSCTNSILPLKQLELFDSNKKGYVVFYLDLFQDCRACISDISLLPDLAQIYTEYVFAAVYRSPQARFPEFRREMAAIGLEDHVAWDQQQRLQKRFHLEAGPYLMFFNHAGEVIHIRKVTSDLPLTKAFLQKWLEQL